MTLPKFVVLLAACICTVARADSPSESVPLIFTSARASDIVFTMTPPLYGPDDKITREAFGVAYRLGKDGKLTEMYRTDGWYSSQVFVSRDGHYLVQMGPWPMGDHPDKTDLAIAFHKDGKLLRSYSTADLIKGTSKVEATISHYQWLAPARRRASLIGADWRDFVPVLNYDNIFTIHTIDDLTYEFDATTGNIKSTKTTGG